MAAAFELAFILILVIANGIFAMSEIAVVSSRKARLSQMANEGKSSARVALELAEEPNRFLSTIQIGITMVGILAGAFGGATLAGRLSAYLSEFPLIAQYSDAISLGIVVVAVAYLSLVIGELVPKRIALQNPEGIASTLAPTMNLLSILAFPVVRTLSVSTDLVLRMLRFRSGYEPSVTQEEVRGMIREGARAGVFAAAEEDMMTGVFRLYDRPVKVWMTLRPDVVWLDINDPIDEIRRKVVESGHSRFPVCDGDLENVVGMVQAKHLLAQPLAGDPVNLKSAMRRALFVTETTKGSNVLEIFRESGTHGALVIDEHGGVEGFVTINNILEEIAGDLGLMDQEVIQHDDGSWSIAGTAPIDEVREILKISRELPGEEDYTYHTLGGFVMTQLGQVPSAGDQFTWEMLQFRVERMNGNRVERVNIARIAEQPGDVRDHD